MESRSGTFGPWCIKGLLAAPFLFNMEAIVLNLKKIEMFILSTVIITTVGLTVPVVSKADPPPWAPAHGHRAKHYKYIYYPGAQVYYSPVVHRYYYMNSGAWTYGPAAPVGINLGKGVSINLGGSVPYVYHPTVIQQYPVVVVPAD